MYLRLAVEKSSLSYFFPPVFKLFSTFSSPRTLAHLIVRPAGVLPSRTLTLLGDTDQTSRPPASHPPLHSLRPEDNASLSQRGTPSPTYKGWASSLESPL